MKRISTILVALLCAVSTIFADAPFRNHRYDSFKVLNVTSDNIVFIGNSITDMHCWPEAFVTETGEYLPIVNRGNSGTYSTEQSDNLESYINGKPKKVFMMIGTNDIATSGGLNFSPEQVMQYVKSIVTRIHARSSQTKVYLYSILKNNTSNRVEATWLKANELIKAYADATDKVTYIDLYDKLASVASGGAWSYDNLHLTAGAYQAWCETICQYLQDGEDYTVSCVYPENTLEVQNNGELGGNSHGMRATYFSCLPISTNDVLVFGDSFVKNGEWQELLGNSNVKNRGTGWGNSGDIATTSKLVDATYATVEGVTKQNAKAIFLYTGTGDCTGSTDIATVKEDYQALVDKIAEQSPDSKIYLMAICPRNNASHNTRIAELNTYMESLASDNSDKIRFVDTYSPFVDESTVNSKYVFSNDYIGGLAYIKMANLMKEALLDDFPSDTYNVTTEADAEIRYAQAGLRNQLTQAIARGLVAERGDEAGQYNAIEMEAFDAKLTDANTLLEKNEISQDEVTAFADELNTILNGALSMPTYSTEENVVWYQLNSAKRGSKYLSNFEAGGVVTGETANNYPSSMWKFVLREDGTTLDIINRKTSAYLSPTAAYDTQISTSVTQPENGWTLGYSNTAGLYIVSSGTVQINQTGSEKVYNWSSGQTGTDRSDDGCQYMISLVEGEPDEEPVVPTDENFSNVVKKLDALTEGWYKMRVVTGSDATMQGYITNSTNHILNANEPYRQNASNFYPLKIGIYNTDKPAIGWVKVKKIGSKYLIQSIGGHAIQEPCTASRDITQGYTTLSMTYGGFTTVDKWSYYNPGADTEQPYVGKASSSSHKYAFAPVSSTELAAYDIYTVTITADNATEIGSDPCITYTGEAAIGGIAKVYNNGYMFFPKGTTPVAEDFTLPDGLAMTVDASAKTLTVAEPIDADGTLTLTATQFASGTSTYTYHGSTTSGGWYGRLVTGTTPALTIESTDSEANNIGWSNNRPWLKAGYTYNLTLPEGYIFVGYELTTLSTSGSYSNTYTYTTAEGTATSETQNVSTEKTVIAEELSTGTVTLTINGDATSSNYGILITNLVINYKELLPTLTYTIDKANGNLYNGTNANQSWNSAWKSTTEPQLVFSCGANNMNWYNDTNVQLMTGQAGSATYTLTAPEGYVIGSYSFTFTNNSHDTGISLAMTDGSTYTTTQAAQTISARNQALSTMSFVLSGTNNKGVVLTNFTVTLVDPVIAGTEDVEGEEALNAAKTTAKATVTANAANLKTNVGYYSYTVAGVKVYEADEVTAAIDAAATVDAVEAILATYALNVPEVGKYYRIKGKSSGKYVDAAGLNNTQMNMKAEADRDFLGSIFLLDEGSKWLNMSTNTYIKDTHSIGANKNGANTWTFEAGSIGYIKLKSNSSSPYLHDNTGTSKTDRCSSDGADHEFSLEEVHAYTITVNGPAAANATATWNGETKKLPATWSLFEGMTVTEAMLTINCASHTLTSFKEGETTIEGNSIEITGLTANRTFTTTFTPDIFSATYGEKWMHITRASNANHAITLGNTAAGTIPTFNSINYANEGTLWCFVGTVESFKIYNRTSGNALALTPSDTPANSVTIELAEDAEATSWHLISYNDGYAIAPVGNTSHGINSFGGNDYLGGPIKFWGVGDGGTHWRFDMIDTTKPLTLSVEVSGEQPYHVNYRVAELTTTIAEQTSKSIVMGNVEAMTYYLPVGATISLENTFTYRGYTFDGFKDAEDNAAEYTNATIPVGGISVTVSYSVDEDNKYQYLYYSNDPVLNKPYRIPAIAVTREGTILAVTDHRPGGSDVGFAPVDIKIRRSNDNGLTWTDEEFIADGTGQHITEGETTYTNVFDYAFGDAAIVADRESDEVLVMCVGGKQNFPGADATHHNYTARLRSHDGGVTWDEPENVTANFMDVTPLYNNENPNNYEPILPDAYSLFFGSGRIFQSRVFKAEGSQYYRIYAAILVREVREGETGASHNNYVVYSDNFGETWNLLGTRCVNGGDEAKVEELPDGTIIISSRKAGGRYFNIFTFTDIAKAEGSWGATATSTEVYDGGGSGTDGEIYKVKAIRNSDNAICDVMLQSVPLGPGRSNVMIHYKEMEYNTDGTNKYAPADFATGWNRGLQVSDRASAYSTMALQTDGNFGFFYEEVPEGYCMVYISLSLEEITNGNYSLYTVNSTIGQYEIGTFYATEAMQIPEGVTAYVATTEPEAGVLTMTELEGIIPANTGAVLRGAASTSYEFIPSISYGTSVEGNMLVGYEAADNMAESYRQESLADGYTTYVLTVVNNQAGFYRKEAGFKVYNNKAYLQVPVEAVTSAAGLRIRFGADEETTEIESTVNGQQTTIVYDLAGRRVENPTHGVYIVNGKKVVVK